MKFAKFLRTPFLKDNSVGCICEWNYEVFFNESNILYPRPLRHTPPVNIKKTEIVNGAKWMVEGCIKHHIHENMELYSSMIKNTLFGNDST